jgi:hypothetical protein
MDQIKCPPSKQNYNPFECIGNTYSYSGPDEIIDKQYTGTYIDYVGTRCLPSIQENGKEYKFFNENLNECIYAHSYKIDTKENLNAYYCTGGIRNQYKNICEIQTRLSNEYSPEGYMMSDCKIFDPINFVADYVPDKSNSYGTCIQKCPSDYIADFNELTNGNNCIKFSVKKKDIKPLDKNSIGDEWLKYCAQKDNLESDECIKTINITPNNKKILGSYTCVPNLDTLPTITISYEEVANYCDDFKKVFTPEKLTEIRKGLQQIDNRLVYISKKYVDNNFKVQTKNNITLSDYIVNAPFSRIYIDEFLIKAIMDGEFSVKFLENTCNNNVKGYLVQIKRERFAGSPELCCDNKGISYYNDLVSNTVNPVFESSIIFKEGKKYTCDINMVKINNPCASVSGNLTLLDKCLKENPEVCAKITGNAYYPPLINPCLDKGGNALIECLRLNPNICPQFGGNINNPKLLSCVKNNDLIKCVSDTKDMCLPNLKDYCMSGGINMWGDGIPRVIEIDPAKKDKPYPENLKYPRCGLDFKRKYRKDYDDVLEEVCNQYDNRNNKGYNYYLTSNICIDYCDNKERKQVVSDCTAKCFGNVITGNVYIQGLNNLKNQMCPPTNKEPNGNVTCVRNFNSSDIKKNYDKSFRDKCEQQCLEENKDKKFNGCIKAQQNYCSRFDYNEKNERINRFFTEPCQNLFKPDPMFGLMVEGMCVMNKTGDMYNYPECKEFRKDYERCMNDSNLANNNNLLTGNCASNFCVKYKNICDNKLVELCKQNPFISKCNDDNFINLNEPDHVNKPFKLSANKREAIKMKKQYENDEKIKMLNVKQYADRFNTKLNEFRDEYLVDFCLDKKNKMTSECEPIIKKILDNPIVSKCSEYNNINDQPICKKLYNYRDTEFVEKVKDFCNDPKYDVAEFNNCEIEASKCNLLKGDQKRYDSCMNEYKKKCRDYINCNYTGDKKTSCNDYKKFKIFYNDKICTDIRSKNTNTMTLYMVIFGIICSIIILVGLKLFLRMKK